MSIPFVSESLDWRMLFSEGFIRSCCCRSGWPWHWDDDNGQNPGTPDFPPCDFPDPFKWTIGATCPCGDCYGETNPDLNIAFDSPGGLCEWGLIYLTLWNPATVSLAFDGPPHSCQGRWHVYVDGNEFHQDISVVAGVPIRLSMDIPAPLIAMLKDDGAHLMQSVLSLYLPDLEWRNVTSTKYVYAYDIGFEDDTTPGQLYVYPANLTTVAACDIPIRNEIDSLGLSLTHICGSYDTYDYAIDVLNEYEEILQRYALDCLCQGCGEGDLLNPNMLVGEPDGDGCYLMENTGGSTEGRGGIEPCMNGWWTYSNVRGSEYGGARIEARIYDRNHDVIGSTTTEPISGLLRSCESLEFWLCGYYEGCLEDLTGSGGFDSLVANDRCTVTEGEWNSIPKFGPPQEAKALGISPLNDRYSTAQAKALLSEMPEDLA